MSFLLILQIYHHEKESMHSIAKKKYISNLKKNKKNEKIIPLTIEKLHIYPYFVLIVGANEETQKCR